MEKCCLRLSCHIHFSPDFIALSCTMPRRAVLLPLFSRTTQDDSGRDIQREAIIFEARSTPSLAPWRASPLRCPLAPPAPGLRLPVLPHRAQTRPLPHRAHSTLHSEYLHRPQQHHHHHRHQILNQPHRAHPPTPTSAAARAALQWPM